MIDPVRKFLQNDIFAMKYSENDSLEDFRYVFMSVYIMSVVDWQVAHCLQMVDSSVLGLPLQRTSPHAVGQNHRLQFVGNLAR